MRELLTILFSLVSFKIVLKIAMSLAIIGGIFYIVCRGCGVEPSAAILYIKTLFTDLAGQIR